MYMYVHHGLELEKDRVWGGGGGGGGPAPSPPLFEKILSISNTNCPE